MSDSNRTSKDESLLGNDILTCLDKHAHEHPLLPQAAKAIRELRSAHETPARQCSRCDGAIVEPNPNFCPHCAAAFGGRFHVKTKCEHCGIQLPLASGTAHFSGCPLYEPSDGVPIDKREHQLVCDTKCFDWPRCECGRRCP